MNKKSLFRPTGIALAVSASLLCFSSLSMASETNRINELEDRLNQLEVELIEAKDAAKKVDRVKFESGDPSPELVSKDGKSTMQFSGRMQLDYVKSDDFFTGKSRDELEPSKDTVHFRRARFGVEGYFSNVWKYSLEFDFDGVAEVEVKDANINYRGIKNSEFKIGFQKWAFGMEATGSSKYLAFLERASTDTFAPDRSVGASWWKKGDGYQFSVGYGVITEDEEKTDVFNGRVTYTPIKNSDHLLHVGASVLHSNYNEAASEVRYRARPSTKVTGRIIETHKVEADSTQYYGIEAAYQHRNLLLQSEYTVANINAVDSDESYSINAGYLQAVYTLTGEKWKYRSKKGGFKTVSPEHPISAGGWGAWEIAARIDLANFNDADAGIEGGEKTDFVLGVNWYLENNLKAQFNYVHSEAEYDNAFENSKGIDVYEQDGNVFQARLQYFF